MSEDKWQSKEDQLISQEVIRCVENLNKAIEKAVKANLEVSLSIIDKFDGRDPVYKPSITMTIKKVLCQLNREDLEDDDIPF